MNNYTSSPINAYYITELDNILLNVQILLSLKLITIVIKHLTHINIIFVKNNIIKSFLVLNTIINIYRHYNMLYNDIVYLLPI